MNKTGDNLLGSPPGHAPGATHLPPSLLLPSLPHGGQASDETLKLAALSFYQNEINQLHKLPGATNPTAAASDQSETEESNQVENIWTFRKLFHHPLLRLSQRTVTRTQ